MLDSVHSITTFDGLLPTASAESNATAAFVLHGTYVKQRKQQSSELMFNSHRWISLEISDALPPSVNPLAPPYSQMVQQHQHPAYPLHSSHQSNEQTLISFDWAESTRCTFHSSFFALIDHFAVAVLLCNDFFSFSELLVNRYNHTVN